MPAASSRRHAPGASEGPDLRTPSQASHLALVSVASATEGERPARTPQEAFCARLLSARERRGISAKTIAQTTMVTTSIFDALERGDISRWPKGIYKRSFFRGYVAAIGLPTDSTVEEFLRLFPDEKPAAETAAARPSCEPAQVAASLRLTLAPAAHPIPPYRRLSRHSALDAAVVFVIALVLVWWSQIDLRTGAAIVALCYYPQLARLARRQAAQRRAVRADLPNAVRGDMPDEVDEAAHVTAAATS
jgi:transcriptional regulator with XRE-family HTH domain